MNCSKLIPIFSLGIIWCIAYIDNFQLQPFTFYLFISCIISYIWNVWLLKIWHTFHFKSYLYFLIFEFDPLSFFLLPKKHIVNKQSYVKVSWSKSHKKVTFNFLLGCFWLFVKVELGYKIPFWIYLVLLEITNFYQLKLLIISNLYYWIKTNLSLINL